MNVKDSLDLLMMQLGNRTNVSLRANCLKQMVMVQQTDLETRQELPWFLESEETTSVVVVGEDRVLLPIDFIREVEDSNLVILGEAGDELNLKKKSWDEAARLVDEGAEAGEPSIYIIRGNYILLRPAPAEEYEVRFPTYYARQEIPSDTEFSENQWFKWVPDLMIAKAGVIIASMVLKDMELAQVFGQQQQATGKRLDDLITAREEDNRGRRMR